MLSPETSAVVKKGFRLLEATLKNARIRNFDCDYFCCHQETGQTQELPLVYQSTCWEDRTMERSVLEYLTKRLRLCIGRQQTRVTGNGLKPVMERIWNFEKSTEEFIVGSTEKFRTSSQRSFYLELHIDRGRRWMTAVFSVLYPYDLVDPSEDRVSGSQERVMSFNEPLRGIFHSKSHFSPSLFLVLISKQDVVEPAAIISVISDWKLYMAVGQVIGTFWPETQQTWQCWHAIFIPLSTFQASCRVWFVPAFFPNTLG